jgi:hypothetical protein
MNVAVCTLFEGGHHHGAAAMINSLAAAGYRGRVYCGIRGPLPPWASHCSSGEGLKSFSPDANGPLVDFVPVVTEAHLTNHKPTFMKGLFENQAHDAGILIYADPDILFEAAWKHFEQLLQCGILLCEDRNSPFHPGHPKRAGWKHHFPNHRLNSTHGTYVNAGFVAVPARHRILLDRWEQMNDEMSRILGGADVGVIQGARKLAGYGFANCLRQADQDTLNAALDSLQQLPLAILGKQAMGFDRGNTILPHATGAPKPWEKNYLITALAGRVPGPADRAYWKHCQGPAFRSLPRWRELAGSAGERIASFIGRFYRR